MEATRNINAEDIRPDSAAMISGTKLTAWTVTHAITQRRWECRARTPAGETNCRTAPKMGGAATTLSRALYMRMHCALYLELLDEGEEYEEAEALSAAEADFLRDAGGASEVSRPQVSPPAPRLLASWPARVRSRALVGRMYNMHMYM